LGLYIDEQFEPSAVPELKAYAQLNETIGGWHLQMKASSLIFSGQCD